MRLLTEEMKWRLLTPYCAECFLYRLRSNRSTMAQYRFCAVITINHSLKVSVRISALTKLSENKKAEFIELMNSDANDFMGTNGGKIVRLTGYQSTVKIWSDTFENGSFGKFQLDERGVPVQLDYSEI